MLHYVENQQKVYVIKDHGRASPKIMQAKNILGTYQK